MVDVLPPGIRELKLTNVMISDYHHYHFDDQVHCDLLNDDDETSNKEFTCEELPRAARVSQVKMSGDIEPLKQCIDDNDSGDVDDDNGNDDDDQRNRRPSHTGTKMQGIVSLRTAWSRTTVGWSRSVNNKHQLD